MSGPDAEDEQAALHAKLDALTEKIRAQRPAVPLSGTGPQPQGGDGFGAAMSLSLKAGSEFVAAILVGGAIGFGLDWVLHTKPFLTIVFFMLGVAAGTVNVIRATSPKGSATNPISRLSDAKPLAKDEPREGPPGASGHKE